MFDAAVAGELKAMYIFGEDVAQTDPDSAHVASALEALDFLVCQDIFPNETTAYADVILPASAFLEKEGTFTNAERRIQLVRPVLEPPGEARTDLEIITSVSRALGHEMGYARPERRDGRDRRADARIRRRQLRAPRRPRPAVAGRPRRHRQRDPLRRALRAARRARPLRRPALQAARRRRRRGVPADPRHRPRPRALQRRHDDAAHRQRCELVDRDWLEIHPDDAARLWIGDGELVSVRSRVGRVELFGRVTDRIEPGHVFTSFHFPEARTNLLVGASADVNTSCPEYKVVAVDVRPMPERSAATPALAEA